MANNKKDDESRRAPRFTKVLPVDCRVIENSPMSAGKPVLGIGEDFAGRTINISESGLLINSDYELDRGTGLEITVMMGDDGTKPIQATVRVAWARRNAFDMFGRWAMGLRVLDIAEEDYKTLQEFFADQDD